MTKRTSRNTRNNLRVLALLGAVTGATLMTGGSASADTPRWSCDDSLPGHREHAGGRCSYDVYPLGPRGGPRSSPGPSPTPPYTS